MSNRRDDRDPDRRPLAELPFWFLDALNPDPCERCGAPNDECDALYWSDSEPNSRTRSIRLCPRCTAAVVRSSGQLDS